MSSTDESGAGMADTDINSTDPDGTISSYTWSQVSGPSTAAFSGAASSQGLTLKYIASFDGGKAKVGLQSIGPDHNFANLSGKDNAVLFYTNRYPEQPLVIKGAGAGADVTAAGGFAGIIRASRT